MALSAEAQELFERAYLMAKKDDDQNPTLYHAALLFTKEGIKEKIDSDKNIKKEIKALDKLKAARKNEIEEHLKRLGKTQGQHHLPSEPETINKSILLSELIKKFVSHNKTKENWTAKTADDYQATFKLVVDIVGDVPVSQINHQKAEDFVKTLQKLPKNIKTSPLYRSKSIAEIVSFPKKETC
jgi:hypothetical protein